VVRPARPRAGAAWRTKQSLLATNHALKSPSRRAGDQSDEKNVIVRGALESLPDLPTLAEAGYKDIEVDNWFGLFAPAKTPKKLVSHIAGWFTMALRTPEVTARLAAQGYYPVGLCGAEFATYLRKQYDDYGRAIREANIKAE
jgi:tripartite-type tricarboxylate transporter receptor subunit TctC